MVIEIEELNDCRYIENKTECSFQFGEDAVFMLALK